MYVRARAQRIKRNEVGTEQRNDHLEKKNTTSMNDVSLLKPFLVLEKSLYNAVKLLLLMKKKSSFLHVVAWGLVLDGFPLLFEYALIRGKSANNEE